MFMKYLLLSTMCSLAIAGSNTIDIRPTKMLIPGSLDGLKLSHNQGQFRVSHDGEHKLVQNHNVDKEIRAVDAVKLKAMLKNGYIAVNQSTNGDYKLQYNGRLKGGLIIGAKIGAWIGKVGVYALGYGTISLISFATGPLAKGTFVTLTKFCAGPIESASNAAAVGLGIYMGATTPI
jgi:hypothetical protein